MNIFVVTGAGGLIGTAIVDALSQESRNFIFAIDLAFSNQIAGTNVTYIMGSVFDEFLINELRGKIQFLAEAENSKLSGIVNCLTEPEPTHSVWSGSDFETISKIGTLGEVRNAAIREALSHYSVEEFTAQLKTNVVGVHAVICGLQNQIVQSGKCSVVNFASQYAFRAPNQDLFENVRKFTYKPPGYSASKAALVNYTEYLSNAFSGTGARFNCIAPGNVQTKQSEEFVVRYSKLTNANRMMTISDVVGPVLFLLSEESSYVNGSTLVADGGWNAK